MNRLIAVLVVAVAPLAARAEEPLVAQPVISVTASASTRVANDRMHALLRAEADDVDPVAAANAVNARMARALAVAKAAPGVEASSAGYSTFQVGEPGQLRWRVTQSLALEGSDFARLAALLTRLQGEDGLLLSGVEFTVSAGVRRVAEESVTRAAIRAWQDKARLAAQAFGASGWRAGRVGVQPVEGGGPRPMYRVQALAAPTAAPVTVEAGTSELTVSVSGEAILER